MKYTTWNIQLKIKELKNIPNIPSNRGTNFHLPLNYEYSFKFQQQSSVAAGYQNETERIQ